MRNRGIELFLLPSTSLPPDGAPGQALPPGADGAQAAAARDHLAGLDPGAGGTASTSEVWDLEAMLAAEGVPGWALPAAMATAHREVAHMASSCYRWLLHAWHCFSLRLG